MNDINAPADLVAGLTPAELVDVVLRASERLAAETGEADVSRLAHARSGGADALPVLYAIVEEKEDVTRLVTPRKVEWTMDWSGLKEDGTRRHPDRPEKEQIFEEKGALALLLLNEVIHLNDHWWEDDWPREARETLFLGVDCSDVFAWGCSDSEGAGHRDIEPVYRHWAKDPRWGPAVWCMIKRQEMPQRPVEKRIRDAGIWDLDAIRAEHGLRPNHYDGMSMVQARRKYEVYRAWEAAEGRDPLPFDSGWWEGWRRYVEAHPGWHDEAWQAEDDRQREEWRIANGFGAEDVPTPDADPADVARRLANMVETAIDRRARAAEAETESARTFLLQEAARTERVLLAALPALLSSLSR